MSLRTPSGRPGISPIRANSTSAKRNIDAVSALERRALEKRTAGEKLSDAVVGRAGRFSFAVCHVIWFVVWIVWNSSYSTTTPKFDAFPFPGLTAAVSLEAIFLSLFILMSENRASRRADERAHLDLQVNLLAEHESTKTLELLQAICLHLGLPQARDPELLELLITTEPAVLAGELERQLPSEDGLNDESQTSTQK